MKASCSVADCSTPARSLGLCSAHYARQRRYGSPTGYPRDRCVIACVDPSGYQKLRLPSGKWVWRHRVVLAAKLGRPLEPGEQGHHLNGLKGDCTPSNIALRVRAHGSGQDPEDVIAWSWSWQRAQIDAELRQLLRRSTPVASAVEQNGNGARSRKTVVAG